MALAPSSDAPAKFVPAKVIEAEGSISAPAGNTERKEVPIQAAEEEEEEIAVEEGSEAVEGSTEVEKKPISEEERKQQDQLVSHLTHLTLTHPAVVLIF